MLFNQRKTIGVFTNKADEHFRQSLFEGLTKEARRFDYNLAVFTTFGNHNSNNTYDEQEKIIVDLAPIEQLDGIVVVPDSYDVIELKGRLLENIRKYAKCPVVSVRTQSKDYYNVLTNEDNSLSEIMEHLINVHGFTRICFMAGYPGHQDSEKRLACYKKIMKKYGLPVLDHSVFYADMWKEKGAEAADFFYSNTENVPQAIVCANDYMALAIENELCKRGIRIPEDVCITGYDGIDEADYYEPQLTTVRINFEKMGISAIDIIHRILQGEKLEQNTYLKPDYLFRGTCGCDQSIDAVRERQEKVQLFEQLNRSSYTQLRQTYFSINMGGCTDFSEVHDEIARSISMLGGYRDFFVCLCKEDYNHLSNEMIMRVAFRDEEDLGVCEQNFSREVLLPDNVVHDEPMSYFFMLLHNKGNIFGYTAISFYDERSFDYNYYNWMITISNSLNEIHNRQCLHELIKENEEKSVKDYLTGLYNRRGFEMLARERFDGMIGDSRFMAFIGMDLDGLKYINDTYGHGAGDFAISSVAKAIQHNTEIPAIAARTGGDEFLVAFAAESQDMILDYIRQFEDEMLRINKHANVPYTICASAGYYFTKVTEKTSFDECLRFCDMCLYIEKQEHHKCR